MENTTITFNLELTPEQSKLLHWGFPMVAVLLKAHLQEKAGEMLSASARKFRESHDNDSLEFAREVFDV